MKGTAARDSGGYHFTLTAGLGMVMGFRVGGVDLRRFAYDLFCIA